MSASLRIAVVDDVAAIRNSLKALLETYGYEVELCESAEAFFTGLKDRKLSCVLFDVRMPGMNGLEAQRLLKTRAPWLPVIIITGHGDIDMAVGAMKEGAFDFIEKPIDDARLVSSIAAAVSLAREASADDKRRAEIRLKYDRLTNRERDVMRLVADGYSTLAIASMLAISVRTVDHHRASIYAKLEVTSLSQLIRLALEIDRSASP
jgi:two-component system response regulator FixJ